MEPNTIESTVATCSAIVASLIFVIMLCTLLTFDPEKDNEKVRRCISRFMILIFSVLAIGAIYYTIANAIRHKDDPIMHNDK